MLLKAAPPKVAVLHTAAMPTVEVNKVVALAGGCTCGSGSSAHSLRAPSPRPSPGLASQNLDIPVILNAPGVGTNMQDRYEVTVTGSLPTNFPSYSGCTFPQTSDDPWFDQWQNDQIDHGIYGTNGVLSLTRPISSSVVFRPTSTDTSLDIQLPPISTPGRTSS